MTSTSLSISQQGAGPSASDGVIFAHVGPVNADGYAAGTVLTFDPGQDVLTPVGPGMVSEFVAQQLAVSGKRTLVCGSTRVAGSIGAVTKSPSSGPDITVGSTDDTMGPADDYDLKVKVTTGGACGTAIVDVALDGASYDYTYAVPPELPGEAIGTVDLTGLDLSTLNTETISIKAEADASPIVVTISGLTNASKPSDLVAFINAFAGVSTNNLASLSQGKYLAIASKALGSTSTETIGAGTANTALGLTAATYTGSASIVNIPATNLKLTFPAGTYVAAVVYSCAVKGPTTSIAAILTALDALKNNYASAPFNRIQIDAVPSDEAELLSWVQEIDAKLTAWQSADPKVFVVAHIGSPMYAGTGLGTNWGATSGDTLIKNKLLGETDKTCCVAPGDCFLTGQNALGSFRRSAVQALGLMVGPNRLSADPGNATFGAVPQCSLKGPDYDASTGTGTLARDESTATVKLGGSQGPGFTVLRNQADGAHFVHGVTRAGAASLFVDLGVLAMTYYAAAIVDQLLHSIENVDFPLNPDGTMQDADAHTYSQSFSKTMQDFLVPPHASAASVALDNSKSMVSGPAARTVVANFQVQERGQGEFIKGSLSIVGTLSLAGG